MFHVDEKSRIGFISLKPSISAKLSELGSLVGNFPSRAENPKYDIFRWKLSHLGQKFRN